MGAENQVCASLQALLNAVQSKAFPQEVEALNELVLSHLRFVRACRLADTSRDMSLAITHAEDALGRALKGIADNILSR